MGKIIDNQTIEDGDFMATDFYVQYGTHCTLNDDGLMLVEADCDCSYFEPEHPLNEPLLTYRNVIKAVKFDDIVTGIGLGAFQHFRGLECVELTNSITHIGQCAFMSCTSLKHITIPGSVNIIDCGTFACCHSLESAVIQSGVTKIRYGAFEYCENLKTIIIPDTVTRIYDDVFNLSPNVCIICNKGSYAEEYAKKLNINFKYITE